jgi:hypothetical protein
MKGIFVFFGYANIPSFKEWKVRFILTAVSIFKPPPVLRGLKVSTVIGTGRCIFESILIWSGSPPVALMGRIAYKRH